MSANCGRAWCSVLALVGFGCLILAGPSAGSEFSLPLNDPIRAASACAIGSRPAPSDVCANALAVHDGELIVGGDFDTAGGQPISGVACWDGTEWHALGSGTDNDVRALCSIGTDLYAGGNFTRAGGNPSYYIGRWNAPASGITDSSDRAIPEIRLENPYRAGSPMLLWAPPGDRAILSVYDVGGRLVRTLAGGVCEITWDGRSDRGLRVPSGIYFLRWSTDRTGAGRAIAYVR
jgi:hypothetical protein